jgi:hypothetical protein
VAPGCLVDHKSNSVQPDFSTDSDLEIIYYEWSWDSNVLFPTYLTQKFETAIRHLNNVAAMTINNINSAVAVVLTNNRSANKTVEDYSKQLDDIRLSDTKPTTSVDNVLIIVLGLITIQSYNCVFKICFTPSRSTKPLFPTYKPREWTKRRSGKNKQKGTIQEMATIRHEIELEISITQHHVSSMKTPASDTNYCGMKF